MTPKGSNLGQARICKQCKLYCKQCKSHAIILQSILSFDLMPSSMNKFVDEAKSFRKPQKCAAFKASSRQFITIKIQLYGITESPLGSFSYVCFMKHSLM